MMRVKALDHLVVQVSNVEASADWYGRVLGMVREDTQPEPGKAPRSAMHFGSQKINLRPIGASKAEWFTANHEAVGSEDLCFLTDAAPDEVVAHLKREASLSRLDQVPGRARSGPSSLSIAAIRTAL
jgi:catechol 2,3-dioxygenase-like lactoylglutathione lyase family enzyme